MIDVLAAHASARRRWIGLGNINFVFDHIWFNYDAFRDLRDTSAPLGEEPLYRFSAGMVQLFI